MSDICNFLPVDVLFDNMVEINSSRTHSHTLVSNWNGKRIYDASKGWGFIWRLVGRGVFSRRSWDNKSLSCFKHSIECAKELVLRVDKLAEQYIKELKTVSQGLKKRPTAGLHYRLLDWKDRLKPVFYNVLKADYEIFSELDCIWERIEKNLQPLVPILEYEALLGESLPYSILMRLSQNQLLESDEVEQLTRFLERANSLECDFPVRELVCLILDKEIGTESFNRSTYYLVWNLTKNGCQLFNRKNSNFIAWRDSLREGDVLSGRVLSKEIMGDSARSVGKHRVFNLIGDDQHVLVMGENTFTVGTEWIKEQELSWAVKRLKTVELDPNGRFALLEKGMEPASDVCWEESSEEILKNQKIYLDNMARLIGWFLWKRCIPQNMRLKDLYFDRNGHLRSIYPWIQWDHLDFLSLEKLIWDFARENVFVAGYLIVRSSLKKHPCCEYFKQVMLCALKGSEDLDALSCSYKVSGKAKIASQRLYKEVSEILSSLRLALQPVGSSSISRRMEKKLLKEFQNEYEKLCVVSILPSDMEARIRAKFAS